MGAGGRPDAPTVAFRKGRPPAIYTLRFERPTERSGAARIQSGGSGTLEGERMTRIFALALALAAPAAALAEATTYTIDPMHSRSQFAVKHLVISTVRGDFGKTTGTINLDEKNIGKSSVEATVDVSTIDTKVADRDNHLKSPDFFDVANHPNMTFKSTKVEKAGADKLKVTGNLTIKGNTKPVVLNVSYSKAVTGMKGETRRAFNATTKINRKEFGLMWSKTVEAGPVVGDSVDVTLDVEAVKEAPKTTAANAEEKKG
jgi:polyisoprenoid-binding protein YceI